MNDTEETNHIESTNYTEEINGDLCVICLSELGTDDYTLECNHKYHTKCIVEWFRKGQAHCPLCNHNPSHNSELQYTPWQYSNNLINDRCSLIRRKFGRKKDCPPDLKKAIDKLRELEENQKESDKQKKIFLNDPIVKQYKIKGDKLKKDHYKYYSRIRKQKAKIVTMMPGYFIT